MTTGSSPTAKLGQTADGQTSVPDVATANTDNDQNVAQSVAPASPTKSSSHDGKVAADDDNSGSTDTDAAATAGQTQAAASPIPPVAAVIANTETNAAPSPASAPTATGAIGEPVKGHVKTALAGDLSTTSTPDATDDAAAKPAATATQTDGSASGSSSHDGKAKGTNDAFGQQTQTQAADDSGTAAQPAGTAQTDADRNAVRTTDLSSISSSTTGGTSNAQGSTGAAKVEAAGLPNFGISATATTSSSAVASPSNAAAAAGVPIAGLAVAIAARAQAGSNQFDIRLDPPELGRIDVRLDINSSGQVTTHVTAERSDTLQLLQSQQPQLERALEQAGLKTADSGLQFTLRDQSFNGQNNGSNSQPGGSAQLVIPDPALTPIAATQIYTRGGLGSGVDIRV